MYLDVFDLPHSIRLCHRRDPLHSIIIMILERSLIPLQQRKFLSNHFRKNYLIFHVSLHAIMTSLQNPAQQHTIIWYWSILYVVMTPKNLSN